MSISNMVFAHCVEITGLGTLCIQKANHSIWFWLTWCFKAHQSSWLFRKKQKVVICYLIQEPATTFKAVIHRLGWLTISYDLFIFKVFKWLCHKWFSFIMGVSENRLKILKQWRIFLRLDSTSSNCEGFRTIFIFVYFI